MFRSAQTVEMLKPIALIAILATIMWSLGLPLISFADAANITDVSDTISDSAPSAQSDHTITFVTPTGVANGATTTINFPAGFNLTGIGADDVDMASSTAFSVAANCAGSERVAASVSGQNLRLNFCTGDGGYLAAGGTTTIKVGFNATVGSTGNNRIVNPSSEGSYEINVTAGTSDSGATRVVILTAVTVSASVDTIFNFTVAGVTGGGTIGGELIEGNTGSTSIPFGTLQAGNPTTSAQMLTVGTNAANGYVVTAQIDAPLQSSTGADIDGFVNGNNTNTPTTWSAPTGVIGSENTYGHWGLMSDDTTITSRGGSQFGNNLFIAASTTPREVMQHGGPVNGSGVGVGTTTIVYKVGITALQEAGDDYSTTLTYIATPTF